MAMYPYPYNRNQWHMPMSNDWGPHHCNHYQNHYYRNHDYTTYSNANNYYWNTPNMGNYSWNANYQHRFYHETEPQLQRKISMKDYGSKPFVVDIEKATKQNKTFRTALWTGEYLQLTLMSIDVGDDIGLEVHPDHDQFIRIEEGEGLVQMGDSKDQLDFEAKVHDDFAIFIPAGKWHNLTNTGSKPLKLYSIYAPPEHPFGTVHETKAMAERV